MDREEILHQLFDIDNYVSRTIAIMIVEDRKYDIPDWFYEFISEETLVQIIQRFDSQQLMCLSPTVFDDFLYNYVKNNKNFNQKALILGLIENSVYHYAYFLNPKMVYKCYLLCNNKDESLVRLLIRKWISINKKAVPNAYLKMYNITQPCMPIASIIFDHSDKLPDGDFIYADYIIPTLYSYWYNDTLAYFNYRFGESLKCKTLCEYYWEILDNNTKIPTAKIPTTLILSYLEIMQSRPGIRIDSITLNKAIKYRTKTDSISAMDSNIIKCRIMTIISTNIDNIDAIYWDLNEDEINQLVSIVTENIDKLKDYTKFYELTNWIPTKSQIITYLSHGGDPEPILSIPLMTLSTYEYIGMICDYANPKYIDKLLSGKYLVYGIESPVNPSSNEYYLFKHNYLTDRTSSEVVRDTILSNNDIVSDIMDESDVIELIDLNSKSIDDIVSEYPTLMISFKRLVNFGKYDNIHNINSFNLKYIPWTYLTTEVKTKIIRVYGYIDPVSPRSDTYPFDALYSDSIKINLLMPTEAMIDLIKTGDGFGYILDYHLASYIYPMLRAAVEYVEK